MKTLIIILILLFSVITSASDCWKDNKVYSFTHTEKWDKEDKQLFGMFVAFQTVDCLQTKEIFKNPEFEELNPIMDKYGEKSVIPYFVGTTVAYGFIAHFLKPESRKTFLRVLNMCQIYNTGRNYRIGIRIKF